MVCFGDQCIGGKRLSCDTYRIYPLCNIGTGVLHQYLGPVHVEECKYRISYYLWIFMVFLHRCIFNVNCCIAWDYKWNLDINLKWIEAKIQQSYCQLFIRLTSKTLKNMMKCSLFILASLNLFFAFVSLQCGSHSVDADPYWDITPWTDIGLGDVV